MKIFKASEYVEYNRSFGYHKIAYLHELMEELFALLPLDTSKFEDEYEFIFENLHCYVERTFNKRGKIISEKSQAEIIGSAWLSIDERIKQHKKKIKQLKKKKVQNVIQLHYFIDFGTNKLRYN